MIFKTSQVMIVDAGLSTLQETAFFLWIWLLKCLMWWIYIQGKYSMFQCFFLNSRPSTYFPTASAASIVNLYRVFNLIWHKKNLYSAKTNSLFKMIFFLMKAQCMTFFVSKFHGTRSCSLAEIRIWSYAVNLTRNAVFLLLLIKRIYKT